MDTPLDPTPETETDLRHLAESTAHQLNAYLGQAQLDAKLLRSLANQQANIHTTQQNILTQMTTLTQAMTQLADRTTTVEERTDQLASTTSQNAETTNATHATAEATHHQARSTGEMVTHLADQLAAITEAQISPAVVEDILDQAKTAARAATATEAAANTLHGAAHDVTTHLDRLASVDWEGPLTQVHTDTHTTRELAEQHLPHIPGHGQLLVQVRDLLKPLAPLAEAHTHTQHTITQLVSHGEQEAARLDTLINQLEAVARYTAYIEGEDLPSALGKLNTRTAESHAAAKAVHARMVSITQELATIGDHLTPLASLATHTQLTAKSARTTEENTARLEARLDPLFTSVESLTTHVQALTDQLLLIGEALVGQQQHTEATRTAEARAAQEAAKKLEKLAADHEALTAKVEAQDEQLAEVGRRAQARGNATAEAVDQLERAVNALHGSM